MIGCLGGVKRSCDAAINAYAFGLYQSLGIFIIPLIVTNCIAVGRAEAFAAKRTVAFRVGRFFHRHGRDRRDVTVLGSLREIREWYADGADSLLGGWAKVLRVEIFHTDLAFPAGDAAAARLSARGSCWR